MLLTHPQFNPIALQITDGFGVHWYGLMYLTAFMGFLWFGRLQLKQKPWFAWNLQMLDDAMFYGALGVVLGGRLGYVLFYQPVYFLSHPTEIFAVWQGGMSFHGGFLGVLVAMALFTRKYPQPWLKVMDFVAPLVPFGLGAGRMGNFINGELWGRPTHADWGMIFPQVDAVPRYPSQLFQFALEGVALFALLWWFSKKQRPVGAISALFLIGYGSFRFLAEFTRQPDDFLGLLSFGLSMGQWLSLPMVLIGIWMMWAAYQHRFEKA